MIMNAMFSSVTIALPAMKSLKGFSVFYPLTHISFLRHTIEASYVGELRCYHEIYNITSSLQEQGFSMDSTHRSLTPLASAFVIGLVARVLAMLVAQLRV